MRIPSDLPSRRPSQRRERRISNRARIILVVLAVLLFFLFLSARGIAGFYTDYLWFDSLGQRSVFTRVLGAKFALGLLFTLGFALLSILNLTLADRVSPAPLPEGADEAIVERYRELVGRRVWLVRIGLSLLLGFIAGAPASSQWQEWLLFTHAVKFGVNDPQFCQDVSLYVFRLPFLTFVVDWLFAAFVIILIVTLFGANLTTTMLVVGMWIWPSNARIMRAQVLSGKQRDYVTAAILLGASHPRVLLRHVIPNSMPPLIANSTLQIGFAISLEAGLAFIGLGDPNIFSWGQMLNAAQARFGSAWWMAIFPGLAISSLVLAFNLMGDAVARILNPQMRVVRT